jgi:hypothetical protein
LTWICWFFISCSEFNKPCVAFVSHSERNTGAVKALAAALHLETISPTVQTWAVIHYWSNSQLIIQCMHSACMHRMALIKGPNVLYKSWLLYATNSNSWTVSSTVTYPTADYWVLTSLANYYVYCNCMQMDTHRHFGT